MEIKTDDKLLVGRNGTSYHTNFQSTGIATEKFVEDTTLPRNLNSLPPMPTS